jgi:Ca2+-binding EF-hand superfamily protein
MQVVVLKSDIDTLNRIQQLAPIFELNKVFDNWNVDLEDIDKILRIECRYNISEDEVIQMLKPYDIQLAKISD